MSRLVSIIICTRNRAESLALTLASIGACEIPVGLSVELLVVDNGSTDHTRQIVEQAALFNVALRYVSEARPGQCRARNRGLAETTGEVIIFTDDDVRPSRGWVAEMSRPILEGSCDAVAGGVAIAPHLHRPWMTQFHRDRLAGTEWLDVERPQSFVGANCAFARYVLRQVPAFDEELGPGALGFYDEVLFARQLVAAGFRLIALPDVTVEHHCDKNRLSRQSFLATATGYGRSLAYVAHHWDHSHIPHPFLRFAKALTRLGCRRIRRWPRRMMREGIGEWEFQAVQEVAFLAQFIRERRRPRAYNLVRAVREARCLVTGDLGALT